MSYAQHLFWEKNWIYYKLKNDTFQKRVELCKPTINKSFSATETQLWRAKLITENIILDLKDYMYFYIIVVTSISLKYSWASKNILFLPASNAKPQRRHITTYVSGYF